MAQRNDDPREPRPERQLGAWIEKNLGLLRGLSDLRELGVQAADAVAAVLEVRELKTMALSWQLWEALALGSGDDPEARLIEEIPYTRIELARRALWGSDLIGRDSAA